MPDDKRGRERQARNADRRQRERAVAAELERMDDLGPAVDEGELARFETQLEELAFPVTGTEIVSEMGHREIEAVDRTYTVSELLPAIDSETYDDPTAVRVEVERPTVAKALKRIAEEADRFQDAALRGSKRRTYEKTFRELVAIDPIDEDEGIEVVREWIIKQLQETGELPGSQSVRAQAADYCRKHGHEVRSDEWLGR